MSKHYCQHVQKWSVVIELQRALLSAVAFSPVYNPMTVVRVLGLERDRNVYLKVFLPFFIYFLAVVFFFVVVCVINGVVGEPFKLLSSSRVALVLRLVLSLHDIRRHYDRLFLYLDYQGLIQLD